MRGEADRSGVAHVECALEICFFPVGAKQGHNIVSRPIEAREPGFRGIRNRYEAGQVIVKRI